MRQSLFIALAFALAAAGATHAAPLSDTQTSVKVSDYGLDLSRPDDASQMLRRLDVAAMEACGADTSSLREYRLVVRQSSCHAASLDRAVAELNEPGVTAVYDRDRELANRSTD